jgi:hypothetical protein
MSNQIAPTTASRKLWWTSRVIGALVLGWGIGGELLLRDQSVELRSTVVIGGVVAVLILSWTIAWLCGIRSFAGG